MLRRLLGITILSALVHAVYGQRIVSDTICIRDTVLVQGIWTYPRDYPLPDTSGSFLATYCDYRKKVGFRFDFGFSQYLYSEPVGNWLGYHQGANLNAAFVYEKMSIGLRFKPWTTNPGTELDFNGRLLPKKADLNPIKYDCYISYEIDLGGSVSIEPSLGYTKCVFKVINEGEIKQNFMFNSTNGFLAGVTVNKYISFNNYKYFVMFIRGNHGFVDFQEVHPQLRGGYTEFCAGVSYKFYLKDRIFNIVKDNRD
jgi:hypothetical protein